jgi:hypothetical protein
MVALLATTAFCYLERVRDVSKLILRPSSFFEVEPRETEDN